MASSLRVRGSLALCFVVVAACDGDASRAPAVASPTTPSPSPSPSPPPSPPSPAPSPSPSPPPSPSSSSPSPSPPPPPAGLVDLAAVDPSIEVVLLYATADNFVGEPLDGYRGNTCYLTLATATALAAAQQRAQRLGRSRGRQLGLRVHDCYRPPSAVTHMLRWARDPSPSPRRARYHPDLDKADLLRRKYVAAPSGHSRGASVDVSLVERTVAGSVPLPMGTEVDFFGERAHTHAHGLAAEERDARALLLEVMSPAFRNYRREWWHFVLVDV